MNFFGRRNNHTNNKGKKQHLNKLEKLIRQKKWSDLSKALEKRRRPAGERPDIDPCRKSSIVSASSHSSSITDLNASMPLLHLSILFAAPLDIIQKFLEIQPDLSRRVDAQGMAPIHVACATRGCNSDLIQVLATHDDGTAAVRQDYNGRTALHYLMFYVCYPKPKDLENWRMEGSRDSTYSDSMSQYSNTSMDYGQYQIDGKVNFSQQDLQNFTNSVMILSRVSFSAYYSRDVAGRTPVDVLHECKCKNDYIDPGPKYERADIVNNYVRQILINNYLVEKKKAEDARDRPFFADDCSSCFERMSIEDVSGFSR